MKRIVFLVIVLAAIAVHDAVAAQTAKPRAKAKTATANTAAPRIPRIAQNPYIGAIVVAAVTGKVLVEDKADAKGYPASVLKLMDLLIILEKIEQRQMSLQDTVTVSAKASKTGGSQVWLAEKEVFTVDELLYALMVQSANDAAVALAEKTAGSSEGFVELMNKRAQALGMTQTVFNSVHGLPPGVGQSPDITTARDFSLLCRELLRHPDALRYTSVRSRPFRPNGKTVMMRTHNHLLGSIEGCDGLKTGYITAAGYSIAVTAARNRHRLVVVVLGSVGRELRDAKAAALLARGFASLSTAPTSAPLPAAAPPAKPGSAKKP